MLVSRIVGVDIEIYNSLKFRFINYRPFNSKVAMQMAKKTVEEDYAVVGSWEDTNITLTVLEHYIPRYFKNAKVAYYRKFEQ